MKHIKIFEDFLNEKRPNVKKNVKKIQKKIQAQTKKAEEETAKVPCPITRANRALCRSGQVPER